MVTIANEIVYAVLFIIIMLAISFMAITYYFKKIRDNTGTLKDLDKVAKVQKNISKKLDNLDSAPKLDNTFVTEEQFNKNKVYQEVKYSEYFKRSSGFFRRRKDLKLAKKEPSKCVLVRMELNNGRFREFLAIEDDRGFKFKNGGKYIFDNEQKYYVIDSNIWAYDFHESLSLPIRRKVNVNLINETMEHSKMVQIKNAINPVTLERYLRSNFIQGLIQSGNIIKIFRILLIIGIVSIILLVIVFLVNLYGSGLLDSLTSTFKGG